MGNSYSDIVLDSISNTIFTWDLFKWSTSTIQVTSESTSQNSGHFLYKNKSRINNDFDVVLTIPIYPSDKYIYPNTTFYIWNTTRINVIVTQIKDSVILMNETFETEPLTRDLLYCRSPVGESPRLYAFLIISDHAYSVNNTYDLLGSKDAYFQSIQSTMWNIEIRILDVIQANQEPNDVNQEIELESIPTLRKRIKHE